ncbi:hypothetical protein ACROYT_G021341 [Oculina patagonica]
MKAILAALLFCHFVVEITSVSSFKDLTAVKLAEFKRQWNEIEQPNTKLAAKLTRIFDEGASGKDNESGAGVGPGPDPELNAVKAVVEALRSKIIPALAKATKRKDEESENYAKELVEKLKGDASRKDLKQALGKAVMELHDKCDKTQSYFLKMANMSGLIDVLRQAMGPEEELDEVKMMNERNDEEGEGFEVLQKLFDQAGDKKVNPSLKSFLAVNRLLAHATCGNPVEGLVEIIEKRADEEDSDNEPFPDLEDKIFPFLGLGNGSSKPCKKGLIDKNDDDDVDDGDVDDDDDDDDDDDNDSLKKKMMTLVLQEKKKKLCMDVPAILRYFDITLKIIDLSKRVAVLKMVDHKQQMVLIAKIKSLMEHGLYGEAAKLVGDATFDGLRRGMLIGLTVKKKLGMEKPSPSPPSKPSGPKELSDLDRILSELEIENDPRY